jgi:hypothetical protein
VASFNFTAAGVPNLRWSSELERSDQRNELTEAVLDMVLMIRTASGNEDYLLLRDPKARNSEQPFDLKNNGSQPLDHSHKRTCPLVWADERSALQSTRWKLGVRRWRVVNRLTAGGPTRVIAEGGRVGGKVMLRDKKSVIGHADATFSLQISSDDPTSIVAALEFDSTGIGNYTSVRNDLLDRYDEIPLRKYLDASQAKLNKRHDNMRQSPQGLHDLLIELREKLKGDVRELNHVKAWADDVKVLRNIVARETIVNFVDNSEISELSLVVGLELDGGTVLDLAHVGTFSD